MRVPRVLVYKKPAKLARFTIKSKKPDRSEKTEGTLEQQKKREKIEKAIRMQQMKMKRNALREWFLRNAWRPEKRYSVRDFDQLRDIIYEAGMHHSLPGRLVFIKEKEITGESEIPVLDGVDLWGSGRRNTSLNCTSTSNAILRLKGQVGVRFISLKGSGWTNQNQGVLADGNDGATNSDLQDVNISECAEAIRTQNNSWNNHFKRFYIFKVKKGVRGVGSTNFVFDDGWITPMGNDCVDYGFEIDKANAVLLRATEVMSPLYDGVWIKDFDQGLTEIRGATQIDNARRYALHIENPGPNPSGWFESVGSFFKADTPAGGVGGAFGCPVFLKNLLRSEIIGGEACLVVSGQTQEHHVIRLINCAQIGINGTRIYGNGSTHDAGVSLENTVWSLISNLNVQNVRIAVLEAGSSDYNIILPFVASGIDASVQQVGILGANSLGFWADQTSGGYKWWLKRDLVIDQNLYVRGNNVIIGSGMSKAALVYIPSANALSVGWYTDSTSHFTLMQFRASDRFEFYAALTKLLQLTSAGKLEFGAAADVNLYRDAAGVLKTDGTFEAGAPNLLITGLLNPQVVLRRDSNLIYICPFGTDTAIQAVMIGGGANCALEVWGYINALSLKIGGALSGTEVINSLRQLVGLASVEQQLLVNNNVECINLLPRTGDNSGVIGNDSLRWQRIRGVDVIGDFVQGSWVNSLQGYEVTGVKVVGGQQPALADVTGIGNDNDGTARSYINAILGILRAHGLIAT